MERVIVLRVSGENTMPISGIFFHCLTLIFFVPGISRGLYVNKTIVRFDLPLIAPGMRSYDYCRSRSRSILRISSLLTATRCPHLGLILVGPLLNQGLKNTYSPSNLSKFLGRGGNIALISLSSTNDSSKRC